MSGIMSMLLGAKSAIAVAVDEFFNRVTLLLPGNGTNGAQNNTFLDSSSNNFTITRNGNATQGTFSPFSQTGWSNFFGGATSERLSLPSSSNLAFGTGDFCVELWLYKTKSGQTGIFSNSTNLAGGDAQFEIQTNSTEKVVVLGWSTTFLTGATSVVLNTWNHIAVCRSGTTMSLYLNGTRDATTTSANNFSSTNIFYIASQAASTTTTFGGYISNLRAVKGSSVYTPSSSSLTVPTAPLTAITNTQLLTCQSNRFIDNSSNAFAITVSGTPSVQAFSPFLPTAAYDTATVGGSGYFDGTGDYLTVASSANFTIGSNNFTVEAWIYITGGAGTQREIIVRHNPGSSLNWMLELTSGNLASFYFSGTGGGESINSDASVPLNQWVHVAGGINGTNKYVCLNGVYKSAAYGSTPVSTSTLPIAIGATQTGTLPFTGYIASSRVVNGTAVYTANYTVPTAPLTAVTNTQLLLNYTNAAITNATAKNDLETVGNAQISTTQSKFGGSSISFDGTGDWLASPANVGLHSLQGDFTIEFWIYPNTLNTFNDIVATANSFAFLGAGKSGWIVYYANSGTQIRFAYQSSSSWVFDTGFGSATSLSTGTWTHIAIVRSGSTISCYKNGTASSTTITNNTNLVSTDFGVYVGAGAGNQSNISNAYIDDLRITKFARYTANFTAPTAAFPLQ
jgi:hypothetical protein